MSKIESRLYVGGRVETHDERTLRHAERPPRTGDVVKHGPTGEEWLVAYYDGRDLVPCGWPCTFAKVEDCTIVERASDEASDKLLLELSEMQEGSDPRARWAKRTLASEKGWGT